jgi:hypothetical protein
MLPHIAGMAASAILGSALYLSTAPHPTVPMLAAVWVLSGILGSLAVAVGYLCPCRHAD